MSGTYTGSLTAPTIDAAGCRAPDYNVLLEVVKERYRAIYGQDVYLESDSQDGELLAMLALAMHDSNSAALAVYAGFSPATAQGTHLARMVKINGLRKPAATYSVVDVALTGIPYTRIEGGVVKDRSLGTRWLLPDLTLDAQGRATVTARASQLGNVPAEMGMLTTIGTPQYGWDTVINAAAATPGEPVETDPALRARQATSTALPSVTIQEGMVGALEALPGLGRRRIYENDTKETNALGIPGNSLAVVAEGSTLAAIAKVISDKKGPGPGTFGTSNIAVNDAFGNAQTIRLSRPVAAPIKARVAIRAFPTFSTPTVEVIKAKVAEYVNALPIGVNVLLGRVYLPANLNGLDPAHLTYEILPGGLLLARGSGSLAAQDINLLWNEVPAMTAADVDVTVQV